MGNEVLLSITIGNLSPNPIELVFTSSQHCEFIISKDGKEIWRWSSDKMFAMALESLVLQTGERRTYTETWKPENANIGKYEVLGRITSHPAYGATCTFEFNT
jgi:hypothetical protein